MINKNPPTNGIRIGQGSDIHQLIAGESLTIGGIKIACEKTAKAHSDGDALYHAIGDAVLGALALGDIGKYFPSSDPKTDKMDSSLIITFVRKEMVKKGYELANLDATITLEKPYLAAYIIPMREKLAKLFCVEPTRISIKAGTNEGCDALGRGEAIKADCVVLLTMDYYR